jgi:hypothetical protein
MQHTEAVELRTMCYRLRQFTIYLEKASDPLVLASPAGLSDLAGNLITFSEAELLDEVLANIDITAVWEISCFAAPYEARTVVEYIEYSQIGFVSHFICNYEG